MLNAITTWTINMIGLNYYSRGRTGKLTILRTLPRRARKTRDATHRPRAQRRGYKWAAGGRSASEAMALLVRGHTRIDATFRFLILWVVIVILWGVYSILYDILNPGDI
jgi:hypothetical protein